MDVIATPFIVRAELFLGIPVSELFLGIPVSVDRRIALPFFREVFEGEDGGDGTDRDAGATIDAFGRINIELFFVFKLRLVLAGMDAIDRADVHTCGVLGADAGFGNHVSHATSPLFDSGPAPRYGMRDERNFLIPRPVRGNKGID